MNKELFMKLLNRWFVEMEIEPKDCHVSHGGAMLMHGLRESTQDIDLTVNKRVWDKFVELGFEVKVLPDCGLVKGISLISASVTSISEFESAVSSDSSTGSIILFFSPSACLISSIRLHSWKFFCSS